MEVMQKTKPRQLSDAERLNVIEQDEYLTPYGVGALAYWRGVRLVEVFSRYGSDSEQAEGWLEQSGCNDYCEEMQNDCIGKDESLYPFAY
jgi:hypothetical protein